MCVAMTSGGRLAKKSGASGSRARLLPRAAPLLLEEIVEGFPM